MNARPSTRRLSFEQCERRDLMAGNVLMYVEQGDLIVTGDSLGNGVEVRQTAPKTFAVRGFDWEGKPTTINGKTGWVTASNVTDDVEVIGGSGNDYLYVSGTSPTQKLAVADELNVDGASGRDTIAVLHAASNRMRVEGGFDADAMYVYNAAVVDNLTVIGGSSRYGTDAAGDYAAVYGDTKIGTPTRRGTLVLAGSNGNDSYFVDRTQVDYLYAGLANGNDFLSLKNSNVGTELSVDGGAGSDTLNRYNLNFRTLVAKGTGYSNFERLMSDSRY